MQTTDTGGYHVNIGGLSGAMNHKFTEEDGFDKAAALRLGAALKAAQLPAAMNFEIQEIVGNQTTRSLDVNADPPTWV